MIDESKVHICRVSLILIVSAGMLAQGCSSGGGLTGGSAGVGPITGVQLTASDDSGGGPTGGAVSTGEAQATSAAASTSSPGSMGATEATSSTGAMNESVGSEASTGEALASSGAGEVDMGAPPEPPEPPEPDDGLGCTSVDFLFVIDNSGSMHDEQEKLLASFPAFIATITDSLAGASVHVGVTTSSWNKAEAPECQLSGSLVTQTGAGGVCTPFAEGQRFATEQDDLPAKFPCMALVGTGGSAHERPVTATIDALDPMMNGPGGCNEGFLRDDAILVIVIITDDPPILNNEDDAHPSTDTSGWYPAVLAAKNGDPAALVVIGFVPWNDISCIYTHPGESPNLIEFVQSFGPRGVLASICEPNFGPIFAEAVNTIVNTCDNFPTPG